MQNSDQSRLGSRAELAALDQRFAAASSRKKALDQRQAALHDELQALTNLQSTKRAELERHVAALRAHYGELQPSVDGSETMWLRHVLSEPDAEVVASAEKEIHQVRHRIDQLRRDLEQVLADDRAIDEELSIVKVRQAAQAQPAEQIADISRGIGLERGSDLALRILFLRHWTLEDSSRHGQWLRIVNSSHVTDDLARLWPSVFPPEFSVPDLSAYEDFFAQLLPVVSQIGVNSQPAEAQWLLAWAFEGVLARFHSQNREAGVWETPAPVADLLARLVCRTDAALLDPACGTAAALTAAAADFSGVALTGIEINADVAARAWMRLRISGHSADIRVGDAFEQMTQLGDFDAVVVQPPWGLRLSKDQEDSVSALARELNAPKSFIWIDFAWLLTAYRALRPGGRAAVILPAGSLKDRHGSAHRYLLDIGAVEGIISLPKGGVFQHTRIGTAVWLLQKKPDQHTKPKLSILMVDAESIVADTNSPTPSLTAEGVLRLVAIVDQWRGSGIVEDPEHIAVSVPTESTDLTLGLDPARFLGEPPDNEARVPEPPVRLLSSISITNFKSFGDPTRIPLAPLTIVFGENSAGKSTVIQSLLLLKQSVEERHLVTQGKHIDVGGYAGIIHNHRTSQPVTLGIEYGTLSSWIPSTGVPNPAYLRRVAFKFADEPRLAGLLDRVNVEFGEHQLDLQNDAEEGLLLADLASSARIFDGIASGSLLHPPSIGQGLSSGSTTMRGRSLAGVTLGRLRQRSVTHLALQTVGLLPSGLAPLTRRALAGLSDSDERIVKSYSDALGQLLGGVAHEVRELLTRVLYLGPLRSPPQRFYNRASASAHPGDAHHIAMYLFDNSNVVANVNDWLRVLEVPYTLDVVPIRAKGAGALVGDLVALSLVDNRSGVLVTPADVGFGISQMLPIVVELLANRESIVCIEQPETHLHPRLQTRLADLFIESARKGDRANQLIVETHSEHIMLRLQRRIREGAIDPEDVSVVYVDQTSDGESTITRLRIDADGEFIDAWPRGFFDERLDELFGGL